MALARALAVLCLAAALRGAAAAIHKYHNDYFYGVGDAFIFRGGREGLYASSEEAQEQFFSWGTIAPGVSNGESEIRFTKLEFKRPPAVAAQYAPDEGYTGLIQAVIFEVNDRDLIGYPTAQGMYFCCTKELVSKTKCHQDRLIVQEKSSGWPRVLDMYFENNNTAAFAYEEAILIEETGMYYLWFVICDEDLGGATVAGQTTWKNPTGFLPGMMLPHIKVFGVLSLCYAVLGVAWAVAYARNWTVVFTLQHCITAVLALGMMEVSTWYFDYVNFNATGSRPVVTTVYAVLLGCLRKTLSRVLVLIVAMGYGVVLPYLGAMQSKVVALAVSYFLAVGALDLTTHAGNINDLTSDLTSAARMAVAAPVAVLDALIVLWVFTALSKTLAQLQARRAAAKLEIYRRFTNTLALMVWISVGWTAYENYVKIVDRFDERWRTRFLAADFWHALSFVFLAIMCWLFRPAVATQRYSYSEPDGEDPFDQMERSKLRSEGGDGDADEAGKTD